MARKQVIVQIDEELLGDLDREAEARGVNRSELIRRAARAFLDALHDAEDERRMVEAYRRIPEDAAETEAMTRIAAEHWPEW